MPISLSTSTQKGKLLPYLSFHLAVWTKSLRIRSGGGMTGVAYNQPSQSEHRKIISVLFQARSYQPLTVCGDEIFLR